jgi:hypothetical protein
MYKYFKFQTVEPRKISGAKLKGTAATIASLCIVCAVFFASLLSSGCNEKEDFSKVDEKAFLENLESAPFVYVPRSERPGWLNEWIDRASSDFFGVTSIYKQVEVHRGNWKNQKVFNLWSMHSNSLLSIRNEKGESIEVSVSSFNRDEFFSKSNGWELIYQLIEGVETKPGTKSALSDKSPDKFKFDNFKPGTPGWERLEVLQRIESLQIPGAILSSISTEGLLETCLDFPYKMEIFCGEDFQKGFDWLLKIFNGYPELLKRHDLIDVLIEKYSDFSLEAVNVRSQSLYEKGMFSFRHFVLEFMLAQDVVLENLSDEQESELFKLALEHKKIKRNFPDIFSNLNDAPVNLLFAKKVMNDNQAADMNEALSEFIQAPTLIEQNVSDYLENYINVKFNNS